VKFIGVCRGKAHEARVVARISADLVETRRGHLGYNRFEYTYVWQVGGRTEQSSKRDRLYLPCLCGRHVEFKAVVGRHSDKACNDACISATGPNCECQCRGENHGAGYAAA
jgi:hypothetical protein